MGHSSEVLMFDDRNAHMELKKTLFITLTVMRYNGFVNRSFFRNVSNVYLKTLIFQALGRDLNDKSSHSSYHLQFAKGNSEKEDREMVT